MKKALMLCVVMRLWNCFEPDPLAAKKASNVNSNAKKSVFRQSIR